MTSDVFLVTALQPAFFLLPSAMNSPDARAFLVAIALQESGLKKRRQLGSGPGRSYFQFEKAGIRGVLKHSRTHDASREVCTALDIPANAISIHRALEFQDVLGVCFARLLIWTLPLALPRETETVDAWHQYLECWRPGKPREKDWAANYASAWSIIKGEPT